MGESAAFALRMSAGIDLDRFEERFGVRAEKYWEREMDRTQSLGLGELTQKTFRLTQTGLRFADSVGAEFVHTES